MLSELQSLSHSLSLSLSCSFFGYECEFLRVQKSLLPPIGIPPALWASAVPSWYTETQKRTKKPSIRYRTWSILDSIREIASSLRCHSFFCWKTKEPKQRSYSVIEITTEFVLSQIYYRKFRFDLEPDKQTDRQAGRRVNRQTGEQADGRPGRRTNRRADRQAGGRTDG